MTAREEIGLLLEADLYSAGDSLDDLRELESFLEPLKHHSLCAQAMKKISRRIVALELTKGE